MDLHFCIEAWSTWVGHWLRARKVLTHGCGESDESALDGCRGSCVI